MQVLDLLKDFFLIIEGVEFDEIVSTLETEDMELIDEIDKFEVVLEEFVESPLCNLGLDFGSFLVKVGDV